jgi:recombination protein RecA
VARKKTGATRGLHRASSAWSAFRPARQVLTRVRAVPTRFIQLDHATRVGGLPIERFGLIHGPSGHGKTYFTLGLIDSFLALNHFTMLVDAERTTPITFAEQLMGKRADHPRFFAARLDTYEETVKLVRDFLTTLEREKTAGNLPPETSAIVVIDSIRKLVPANILAKLMKEADGAGVDGMGGRAAQIKAAMNAAWMDECTPLLEKSGAGLYVIAREAMDPDASAMDRKYGKGFKVGGGAALYYDASMVFRVERESYVTDGGDDDGKNKKRFGERHRVTIRKTKVAGQEERQTQAYFHTSNGVLTPFGFDRARDVVEIGERFGVVVKSGTWFSAFGERLGQGLNNAVLALTGDENLPRLIEIERAVREKFETIAPTEFTDDGEVL